MGFLPAYGTGTRKRGRPSGTNDNYLYVISKELCDWDIPCSTRVSKLLVGFLLPIGRRNDNYLINTFLSKNRLRDFFPQTGQAPAKAGFEMTFWSCATVSIGRQVLNETKWNWENLTQKVFWHKKQKYYFQYYINQSSVRRFRIGGDN